MLFIERIAVEVEGDGEPVLMIHGLGGTTNTFTPLLPAFASACASTCPGSGRSSRVEGPLSEKFVEAAKRVMHACKVEKYVVGHSMGTIVATHLAAAEPNAVRSLALFGSLLAPPDQARRHPPRAGRGEAGRDAGHRGCRCPACRLETRRSGSPRSRSCANH